MTIKNIPVIIFVGMFFFCVDAMAGALDLSVDLFEKNEWVLCRRECKRALLTKTEPIERFQLLAAMSAVHMKADPHNVLDLLKPIVMGNRDTQASAMASYEIGRLQWQINQPEKALHAFATAFHSTTNKALFHRSACSILLLFKEHPGLEKNQGNLIRQIATSRNQLPRALFLECARPGSEKDKAKTPNWIVRFYRSQISPAIGQRCTLDPSCSEYFHQAAKKHNVLLAVPLTTDRFVREPEVNSKKNNPVLINGMIRYRDSVDDHDFWMSR